jgi:hypothetical protein
MITDATSSVRPNTWQSRAWSKASVERLLSFAAAPTFATMALMTVCFDGRMDPLCSAAGASPFSGMVPMYLLMSAFHSAPWLRLISARRR